jgi:amidase
LRTTSGSRLRQNHIPDRDATVVARLKTAGAIILGKTNVSEMALPYETENPIFGRTNNPHDLKRTPGGSSGGEAAAIAGFLSPAGLGSDLSGSIRVPAHFCGIAGLKPSMGRVPMDGHTPEANGLLSLGACIGPMARTVADLELLFRVIADPIPNEHDADQRGGGSLKGLRVAWYTHDGNAPVTKETSLAIVAAARALGDAGCEIKEDLPPGIRRGPVLWIELFARIAANQLREFYRGREDEAGPDVARFLPDLEPRRNLGDKIDRAEKVAAAVVERERLREDLLRWMKSTPLILAPVGATPAFAHHARHVEVDGEPIKIFRGFGYSQTFNVFGLPSVVVPVGRSKEGLPIGMQIIGLPFAEQLVIAAASIIESAMANWQT